MIDITHWTPRETELLLDVAADPLGSHDIDGVRVGVLERILKATGLWTTHWENSLAGRARNDMMGELFDAPRYSRDEERAAEARILARQGCEFGTTDAY